MPGYGKFENEASAPAREMQQVAQAQEQSHQYTYQPTGFVHPAYPPPQQQPGVYGQDPPCQNIMHVTTSDAPTNDYFGLALFVTLCCCLPLGIVGLIKSNDVKHRLAVGDIAGAQLASQEARRYSMIGLSIGMIIVVVNTVAIILLFATGTINTGYNGY